MSKLPGSFPAMTGGVVAPRLLARYEILNLFQVIEQKNAMG